MPDMTTHRAATGTCGAVPSKAARESGRSTARAVTELRALCAIRIMSTQTAFAGLCLAVRRKRLLPDQGVQLSDEDG
jgi:hypothetical protein